MAGLTVSDSKGNRIWMILLLCCFLTACNEADDSVAVEDRNWQAEMLSGVFKKPVSTADPLLFPEVRNLKQLEQATKRVFMPADTIYNAFSNIRNMKLERSPAHIARLTYEVPDQDQYEAFAYIDAKEKKADTAYLIIPGSGVNEASKIFYGNEDDYHCCLRGSLDKTADLYVYVKPNNDFLAIHHQGKVMNGKVGLFPQLIAMGGSYSTRYLVDAIAFAKHLKAKYKKVAVVGLSQGGNAALFVALQAQPDAAVVSSGFSVMNSGPVYIAGINQLVIPGFLSVYSSEHIVKRIQAQPTRYLFTYGQGEKGVYGYEAVNNTTEKYFKDLANVQFHYHSAGHVFPVDAITAFLSQQGF